MDRHSLQHSDHVTSQFGWISVSRKIAFPLCALKATTQRNFAGGAATGCFLTNGPRRISDCQRTLNHEASCWKPRITRHPGRTEEYLFDDIPRLGCRQSLAEIGKWPVHVSIENLAKKLLFVAKSSVKTRAIDSHGPRQVGERGAFVTYGPKNVHGAFQGRVRIEGAGSPALCRRNL